MLVGLSKEKKAKEVGEDSDIRSIVSCAHEVIHDLLTPYNERDDPWFSQLILRFKSLKNRIDKMEEEKLSSKDLAIIEFLRLIVKNDMLHKELEFLKNCAENFNMMSNQLEKVITTFKLKDLEGKVRFLMFLKEKESFTAIQKAFEDEWSFYDLINDKNFKEIYIDKAVDELESKDFRKSINRYVELVEEGKKVASKYFGEKGVELQAYYTEDDNGHRILNVNNNNENEQVRISDILQYEENTDKLNICCNKKQKIHAYREGKKRYYKFEKGTCYGMESTWHALCEDGSFAVCTIVMNVSSDGIDEILEFKIDDKNCKIPDEWVGYNDENGEPFQWYLAIEKNDELYIQGIPLIHAIEDYQEKGREKINSSFDSSPTKKAQKGDSVSSNMEHIDAVEKVAESRNLSFPH